MVTSQEFADMRHKSETDRFRHMVAEVVYDDFYLALTDTEIRRIGRIVEAMQTRKRIINETSR